MSKPSPNDAGWGTAELSLVARHHGVPATPALIWQLAKTDEKGTDLEMLKEAAEQLGFMANAGKAKPKALDKIPLPAIVHLERPGGNVYAVLFKVTPDFVEISDSSMDVMKVGRAEFDREFSGGMLLVAPKTQLKRGGRK